MLDIVLFGGGLLSFLSSFVLAPKPPRDGATTPPGYDTASWITENRTRIIDDDAAVSRHASSKNLKARLRRSRSDGKLPEDAGGDELDAADDQARLRSHGLINLSPPQCSPGFSVDGPPPTLDQADAAHGSAGPLPFYALCRGRPGASLHGSFAELCAQ
ncbi:hypothetical protein M885DRAFT_509794 [Pelagophyceae sp. CCMP2097]|nr:hypothetical protein M885DRAFT_509794 [Pelagophyceae sp. CCMP2097]|mmetsp:Transcript_23146/g.78171  ORF Transcript_23146/g.78171 Transcript_23146/m.78171 type:complete len:159 (+) Transcript_23146:251-727(+)